MGWEIVDIARTRWNERCNITIIRTISEIDIGTREKRYRMDNLLPHQKLMK